MMKLWATLMPFALLLAANTALAAEAANGDETEQVRGIVRNIMDDNASFVKSHKPGFYKPFINEQHPRATVVTCSDSRVQTDVLDQSPDGDLFMVRNIGNQIATTEGSVDYGVLHLHTPLLLIIGHVACGAIKAAQSDQSKLESTIKREIATIKLPPKSAKEDEDEAWLHGVEANVDHQVTVALSKYDTLVKSGKLTVIGAVYDFQNAMHQGQGRLVITNINGKTDAGSIMSGLMTLSHGGLALEKQAAETKAVH
jgi:carbonic anhydrase